ncbi:MAG TPA: TolC family protein, partial [Deferrisomatales bacterium]|nr:TolC family protein [Deferrisomatales bacterium]
DLRIDEIAVPIGRDEVIVAESVFDPELDASLDTQTRDTPTADPAGDDQSLQRSTGAGAGIVKRFRSGFASRLGVETRHTSGDPSGTLDPEYRGFLVLDLTQPLLRNRGAKVNTSDIRVSENRVRQATYDALDRAQRVGEDVELTYRDLALSQEVLGLRRRSRDLARELAQGNREKLEAGTVPITEVQQAETAVASRDEQLIAAKQAAEVAEARLKDLLHVRPEDALYAVTIQAEALPTIDTRYPGPAEALAAALEGRPDLLSQRVAIESQNVRLAFFDNQQLPRLDLAATLGVNGLSGWGSGSHEGPYGESWTDTAAGEGYEWFAGIRFSYPLGNRAAAARQRQAGLRKSQAICGLKRLERGAETEVQTALVAVRRGEERFRVAERFVSLAATTLEQEQQRLGIGLSDTFRILRFQDDVIEAKVRRATALAGFHKGLARLYRAVGNNLERYGIVYEIDSEEIPHV